MASVLYTLENGVAKITLNRPEVYNSFNQEMALRLQDTLDACEQDEQVRCLLLTGAGKAFCAGQDLNEVIDPNGPPLQDIVGLHYNPIILRLRNIEKPVVCAVNGVAAGAGANIALACDIVIARRSASFIQAFSKIGLIPDSGGTFTLPRLIGWQKATALIMLGDKVPAEEAERLGMIYQVCDDEALESTTISLASRLAQMPTRALGLAKQALNRSLTSDLAMQLAIEEELQTMAGHTDDYEEGVAAFLEKRTPVFKGK